MPHANFDFINSNYNFSDTALNKNTKIKPYKIFKRFEEPQYIFEL